MLTFGLQDCNMSCLCNIVVLLLCNSWLLNKLSTEAPAGRPKLGPRRALQCICMATGAEQVLQPQSRLMYPSKVSHDLVQARKVHNSHVTKGNSSWSWYLAPTPAHTTPLHHSTPLHSTCQSVKFSGISGSQLMYSCLHSHHLLPTTVPSQRPLLHTNDLELCPSLGP